MFHLKKTATAVFALGSNIVCAGTTAQEGVILDAGYMWFDY